MKIADISVELKGYYGSDLDVVNAARVSFDKESKWEMEYGSYEEDIPAEFVLSKKDCGLISYLAKHKHHSPFNHCFLSFRVKAPIFVARQLVKHKFLPWNEVSRRYVDDEPEFYVPYVWRGRSENKKQGSEGEVDLGKLEDPQLGITISNYEYLLAKGVCPEQARMVLPQSTMTTWIWSGTLGAFLDMLKLRLDPHTQKETRIVAEKIYEEVKQLFPVSTEAYLNA